MEYLQTKAERVKVTCGKSVAYLSALCQQVLGSVELAKGPFLAKIETRLEARGLDFTGWLGIDKARRGLGRVLPSANAIINSTCSRNCDEEVRQSAGL